MPPGGTSACAWAALLVVLFPFVVGVLRYVVRCFGVGHLCFFGGEVRVEFFLVELAHGGIVLQRGFLLSQEERSQPV